MIIVAKIVKITIINTISVAPAILNSGIWDCSKLWNTDSSTKNEVKTINALITAFKLNLMLALESIDDINRDNNYFQ